MNIRIPPKADIDLRNAFLDIEERLRKIESRSGEKISEEIQIPQSESAGPDLDVEGDLNVDNDVRISGSVDAPHLYEGLIKVVPTGIGSDAQRVINMAASLAIAPGGLSADSVRTRSLWAPRASVFVRADTQTIPNDTHTEILWTECVYDNAGMWNPSATDRITITEQGVYLVGGLALWATNATGLRSHVIDYNNNGGGATSALQITTWRTLAANNPSNTPTTMPIGARYLVPDDYVQTRVYQNSTGDLDINGTGRKDSTMMWVVKISD